MDESGARIITYPSTAERQRRVAQRQRIDSRNANIDGVSLHVLAVLRHARRTRTKKLVTPFAPVSANNVDLRARMPDRRGHIGKYVEHSRIIVFDVACSMVAKEMIQLFFRFRKVDIAATVHNVNVLACMRVIKAKMMFLRRSGFCGKAGVPDGDNREDQKSETEPKRSDCLQQTRPPTYSVKREEKSLPNSNFTGRKAKDKIWDGETWRLETKLFAVEDDGKALAN